MSYSPIHIEGSINEDIIFTSANNKLWNVVFSIGGDDIFTPTNKAVVVEMSYSPTYFQLALLYLII